MQTLLSQGTRAKQGGELKLAIFALICGWAIIAWPWLSGRVTVPWDAKAHFLPQLQFLAASFAKGESPFWTPNVFSGHPQIADPQSLIFSPPYLLLALLDPAPSAWAQDVTLYLMLLVSSAVLIIWFRDRGWHAAGGLIAALSFAFGAAMAWRIQHVGQVMSLAYLPPVLLFLDRALERRSIGYALAAGITAGFMVLGRDQVALLAVYFLIAHVSFALWTLPKRHDHIKEMIAPLTVATLAGLLIIAIPVALTHLVAAGSNRPSISLEVAGHGSLHPALFLTALAPDVFGSSGAMGEYWGPPSFKWKHTGLYIAQNVGQMYIGAAPYWLLLWGVITGVLWAREMRVFILGLIASVFYGLGWYTPVFGFLHAHMPGIGYFRRPADAVFVMGFFASVLAGYALHRLLSDPPPALAWWSKASLIAFPATAFALMFALAQHYGKLAEAGPIITLSAAMITEGALLLIVLAYWRDAKPMTAIALLVIFTICDLAYSNGPGGATALPPGVYAVLDSESKNETIVLLKKLTRHSQSETRRDRIELAGLGFHWPNASLSHGLENTLGYNPLQLSHYARASGSSVHAGQPSEKGFSALMPSYRSPFSDLLGLRYIATGVPVEDIDKSLKPGGLTLIAQTADGYVYENPHALPRVLFAHETRAANFERLLETGELPNIDFKSTVLLETAPQAGARKPGTARITSYHNTEIKIESDSPDGGWLVLNDIWQPWWFADVDGKDAPVLRANVIFRSVEVPPGKHTVTFRFRPIQGAWNQLCGMSSP